MVMWILSTKVVEEMMLLILTQEVGYTLGLYIYGCNDGVEAVIPVKTYTLFSAIILGKGEGLP